MARLIDCKGRHRALQENLNLFSKIYYDNVETKVEVQNQKALANFARAFGLGKSYILFDKRR